MTTLSVNLVLSHSKYPPAKPGILTDPNHTECAIKIGLERLHGLENINTVIDNIENIVLLPGDAPAYQQQLS